MIPSKNKKIDRGIFKLRWENFESLSGRRQLPNQNIAQIKKKKS